MAKTVEVTEPLQRFSPGAAIPWQAVQSLENNIENGETLIANVAHLNN